MYTNDLSCKYMNPEYDSRKWIFNKGVNYSLLFKLNKNYVFCKI
jgi:hypothetical protein